MRPTKCRPLFVAVILLAVACHEQSHEGTTVATLSAGAHPSTAEPSRPRQSDLDQWIGRWNGPEGTYLSIEKSQDGYTITVADLDGPKRYGAQAAGDHLEFERNGKIESVKATNGKNTGMKWLQEKSNCLTIKLGEGFCQG